MWNAWWWVPVGLALMWSRAEAAEVWSVTPPASWRDVTAETMQQPEASELRKKLEAALKHVEFRFFADDAGNALQVIFTSGSGGSLQEMHNFEAGARDAARATGTQVSYQSQRVGHALVSDQTLVMHGTRLINRRICGTQGETMLAVQATCRGTDEICRPILETLSLDPARLTEPRADSRSSAYKMGRMVGAAFLVVLVVTWLVSYSRRRANQPPSS